MPDEANLSKYPNSNVYQKYAIVSTFQLLVPNYDDDKTKPNGSYWISFIAYSKSSTLISYVYKDVKWQHLLIASSNTIVDVQ